MADAQADETTRKLQKKRRRRFVAIVVVVVLAMLFFVPSASYRMEPGPVFPLKETTQLQDPYSMSDTDGDWQVLTVEAHSLKLIDELLLRTTGRTDELHQAAGSNSPYTEETAAEAVSSRQLSLNVAMNEITEGNGLLLLEGTGGTGVPDGSRILSIDGHAPAAGKQPKGTWLIVTKEGKFQTVKVEDPQGITAKQSTAREHPDPVKPLDPGVDAVGTSAFALKEVGGSSAGLVMTLAWIDTLTGGDLTDGRTIAATGTVDENGKVLPVGGVQFKLEAAAANDADIVLVPEDYDGPIPDGLRVVPVATVDQALQVLAS